MIEKMFDPPKIGIYCIACGKLAREEYFTGNIDVLVCDECKDAIAWAKGQMKNMKALKGKQEVGEMNE